MKFLEKLSQKKVNFPTDSLILILGLAIILGGCLIIFNEGDVEKRLSEIEKGIEELKGTEDVDTKIEKVVEDKSVKEDQDFETVGDEDGVTDYVGESDIEILSPEHNSIVSEEPVVFTGKVTPDTKKIVVNAVVIGEKGETYSAIYTIRDFQKGDNEFTYSSKEEWKNLVKGSNNYQFTAFFDDGTSKKTTITIYYE